MCIRRDTTGFWGKSLCYNVHGFDVKLSRVDSVVIVVSSLKALMTNEAKNVRVKDAIVSL